MPDPAQSLNSALSRNYGAIKAVEGENDTQSGGRRQIGLISAIFIIFNRIVGAG